MTTEWTVHVQTFDETEVIEFEDYRTACAHAEANNQLEGVTTDVYDCFSQMVRSTGQWEIKNYKALTPNSAGRYRWNSALQDMRKVES